MRHVHRLVRLTCAAILLPSLTGAAVLEIDQACVLAGCFPGDGSGFPVTITAPGEYRLTSNLDTRFSAGPENLNAIVVASSAGGVDIDLNGFDVRGPVTCTPATASCAPAGTGIGISGGIGTSVRDGTVRGFAQTGVSLSGASRVERVRAWNNGGNGIFAGGEGSVVVDSLAFRNGNDGIHTYRYATIRGVMASKNGRDGVFAEQEAMVDESHAWWNGRVGFWGDVALNVRFSVANQNLHSGLSGFAIASVGAANTLRGMTSGIGGSSALQCVLAANGAGSMTAAAISMGQNSCNGAFC